MSKERTPLSYLKDAPNWVLLTVLIALMVLPFLRPLGLPIAITRMTTDFYDAVEKVPTGSVVLVSIDYESGGQPSIEPGAIAVFHHIFKRSLKALVIATNVQGPLMYNQALSLVRPENYQKTYGTDYVFLGYVPGEETAMAAILSDIRKLISVDYLGKPLDQLPMMRGVNNYESIRLVMSFSTGGVTVTGWIRQANTGYKIPVVVIMQSMMVPSSLPFYDAGQMAGIISDVTGAAEYEKLVQVFGMGTKTSDVMSLSHVLMLIILALGNIGYFADKKRSRER